MAVKTRTSKTSKGERKSSRKNPQTPLALVLMGKGVFQKISPIGGAKRPGKK